MKITISQLRKIIAEEVKSEALKVDRNQTKFQVVISQDRDQFTDMMGGGSYYTDSGWPEEGDDPNCETFDFDNENDARSFAEKKFDELDKNYQDSGDSEGVQYRALIFTIGPRGKKTLLDEIK